MVLAGISALALIVAVVVTIIGDGFNTGLFVTAAAFGLGTYFNWKHDRNTGNQSKTSPWGADS